MNTQEFWKGEFGDDYTARNVDKHLANMVFFNKALPKDVNSVIEFGAGTGQNLLAIKAMRRITVDGVELNCIATEILQGIADSTYQCAVEDFSNDSQWDLTLTKGLLIHIPPANLERVYEVLYQHSRKYILLCEYFNPTPVEVEYRGHSGVLWKRDFCSEMLNRYNDLKLIDYGFSYHRDVYPQDNLHWFLMKKGT